MSESSEQLLLFTLLALTFLYLCHRGPHISDASSIDLAVCSFFNWYLVITFTGKVCPQERRTYG